MLRQPPMRYPNSYVWIIFVSSLDIMLTWVILDAGGREVNPLADRILAVYGLKGLVLFKFTLILFVILACEWVGRVRNATGRRLALLAVAICLFPVVWSIVLITRDVMKPQGLDRYRHPLDLAVHLVEG